MTKASSEFRFVLIAGSIFVCYFIYGMLQEKITRGKYGDSDKFTCTLSLVLVHYLDERWTRMDLQLARRTIYYFSSALTYLLGMVTSNLALQWINYPTQVVGKAAKPIPVMILGVLIGRKVYPLRKYLFVFLIVTGVVLFMYKDQSKKASTESLGLGIGELSSIILSIGVVLSGEIIRFISFVTLYPEVLVYMAALALMGALGQLFIFFMVSEFGPLPCSVVTTTRKFFTVLASVIIFGNVLQARQWLGAIIVFSGLFLDIFYSKGKSQTAKKVTGK
ncbi:hypothetical protein MSG28_000807 [Choristoneura fumiferana]|uniref:Uncharacterized protein n=1 Tax=Choristoneura fumiferana TaxID=7141 RepID=A0ACC0K2J1_CHOFU|nr:hypothetical protein MSG28_000807 [Choristoneura fumiferana]